MFKIHPSTHPLTLEGLMATFSPILIQHCQTFKAPLASINGTEISMHQIAAQIFYVHCNAVSGHIEFGTLLPNNANLEQLLLQITRINQASLFHQQQTSTKLMSAIPLIHLPLIQIKNTLPVYVYAYFKCEELFDLHAFESQMQWVFKNTLALL